MEQSKISPQQLFCLIVLFEFGTALIVPLGIEAKQDAWIAELLGMAGGIVLLVMYYYLYRQFPNLLLTSYIKKIIGKHLGFVIGLLYVLFFIYGGARDLRDATELILFKYNETPIILVSGLLMSLVCYALYKGLEVLARTGELFIVTVFALLFFPFIITIFTGTAQIKNILPILENGWKPVLTTVFPNRIMFPYGELICFTVIFPYLKNHVKGMKFGLIALIISGIVLVLINVIEIAVLGVNRLSIVLFPLLNLVEKINVGGFIQGLRGIEMLVLIIGVFFKVTIFSYAAVISITDLFKIQDYRNLVVPIGLIIVITSILIAENLVDHLNQGKFVLKTIFPLFQFVIPMLLLIIVFIQKLIQRMRKQY
jgi:spore germination protein KB